MSVESWKAEFYPIPADKVTEEEAVGASLLKWQGLTEENLSKHGCYNHHNSITDGVSYFDINGSTCPLCLLYLDSFGDTDAERCNKCPIYKMLGRSCDSDGNSEYGKWTMNRNPQPMIDLLKKIIELKNESEEKDGEN